MKRRLTRSVQNKTIAGVCGGLAEYLDVDVTLIRVAFIIGIFTNGIGLLAYIIMWIATPTQSAAFTNGMTGSFPTDNQEADNYRTRRTGAVVVGVSLILVGVFTLVEQYFPELDFEDFFPYLFIAIGGAILAYGFTNRKRPSGFVSDSDTMQQQYGTTYSTFVPNDMPTIPTQEADNSQPNQ